MRILLGVICSLFVALVAFYLAGKRETAQVEIGDPTSIEPLPGGRLVETRSGRVHVVDVGQGPAILLLHGSGRSVADWQEGVIDRVSPRHRVVAFDFYGFGFSERNPRFTYGYNLWVQQAVDVLDVLEIEHVTVVGHSVGGALACILAVDHPTRVDHVVTIGTGMTIEPAMFLPAIPGFGEWWIGRETMYGPAGSPRDRAALEAAFRIPGTHAALLSYIRRQMFVDGFRLLRGVFEDLTVPVLHVSGAEDRNIPPAVARALTQRTHGRFVLIPRATHNVHIDAPPELVEAIEGFLAER
jgi:2-hydroxymuconate-semialdehyde hydrolase